MLRSLTIRDVVLIDRLDLTFDTGLSALTGETGAGKSILLDALGLALGVRGDARLIRHGAAQASAAAEFLVAGDHPVRALLAEHGIADDGNGVMLRRVIGREGRSRAFVNDQPVGVALLRRVGETLVEVHGQFESQRLLSPATHRLLLDAFGGLTPVVGTAAAAHRTWQDAAAARTEAEADLERSRRDEDFLRHAVEELDALTPQAGEEDTLAGRRTELMHGERLLEAMNQAAAELTAGDVEGRLRAATRHLERVADKAAGRVEPAIAALDRAAVEAAEGADLLHRAAAALDLDPRRLEEVEERLFALRAVARKHGTDVDGLADLHRRLAADLAAVEDGGAALARLAAEEDAARERFMAAAAALTKARTEAAARLDTAVAAELRPLKLDKATVVTRIDPLPEAEWSEHGCDRVLFEVATNPGTPPGPLARIASGGELARFMLAMKVVLAGADPVPTLIFDEVDAGVGGAVAAAVGERLAGLAEDVQVLVVTHSPQVAARGDHHWRVAKSDAAAGVVTTVESLGAPARREEIARMLAGAQVTDEARAAASSLLEGRGP